MIGHLVTIFLSTFQGSSIVSDNDYEYCYHFNGYEFDRVLFLFRYI